MSFRVDIGPVRVMVGPPNCAVCGQPVEEFVAYDPPDSLSDRVFIARCHGEEERVTLTMQDFRVVADGVTVVTFGEAFAKRDGIIPTHG